MATAAASASSHRLRVCTFNCKGHGPDRVDYIRKLLDHCDMLYIQEHWLLGCNIQSFADAIGNVNIYGMSGMNESELLVGRPYGGCAFIWKKSLDCSFEPIHVDNKRIVAGVLCLSNNLKVLLCNVYMPCSGYYVNPIGTSFDDVLNDLQFILNDSVVSHVIIGGDFNTDFSRYNTSHVSSLTQFCLESDLYK